MLPNILQSLIRKAASSEALSNNNSGDQSYSAHVYTCIRSIFIFIFQNTPQNAASYDHDYVALQKCCNKYKEFVATYEYPLIPLFINDF